MRIIPKNIPVAAALHPLRLQGLRLTGPRRAILEAVRAADTHPPVGVVYRRVRRTLPRVSLATVYRNLRLLAAKGLVVERPDPRGVRFDGNLAAHDHFTCVACGRIYDVPAVPAAAARRRLGASTGFEVLDQRVEFYGRCAVCRRRRGPSSTRRPRRT